MACCRKQFLHNKWPIQLVFLLFVVCRIFLSVVTVRNTSSFLTRSVQPIFSVTLQHHISELSLYFWSLFQNDQFRRRTQLCSQFSTLLVSYLNFSSICWWIEPSSCWMMFMQRILYTVYCIQCTVYCILSNWEDLPSIYDAVLTNYWHFDKIIWFIE